MKAIMFVSFFSFSGLVVFGQLQPAIISTTTSTSSILTISSTQSLIGKWEGKDSLHESYKLEFVNDSILVLSIHNQPSPFNSYKITFSKNPMWFDLFDHQKRVSKCLLQLSGSAILKWQLFPDGNRQNNFLTNNPSMPIINFKKK